MPESFDVFLSHTGRDKRSVRRIATALRARGLRVWLDEDELRPGIAWQDSLEQAIANSRSSLVIIGDKGVGPWEQEEMRAALVLARRDRRPVIPVFLPGAEQAELPLFLSNITSIRLESWDGATFDTALNKIVWAITGKPSGIPKRVAIPKVFLCHAKEDDDKVRNLYFRLRDFAIDPWYDKEKLTVGDRWEQEIIQAIENTDFFAICLSSRSIKKTGFIQREIKLAVKEYQRRPQQFAFLLPVRLEPCEIPKIKLDDVTTLSDLQWIDLFDEDQSLKQFADGVKRQFTRLSKTGT